ncbi:MAG: M3 family metallopeptidase [Candidatus Symbiothrix sp.]|jgi:peptidyl-dipeptidase Dcp|nr:M3 family metallopeptidase [Candidatus Symbiothrix sp.]
MQKISLLFSFILLSINMLQSKNPFLATYRTPHATAPFNEIKIDDYKPAFESAMQAQNREIDKIVSATAPPTFQNTIEALEYTGSQLDKVSSVFFNLLSAESSDEMMKLAQSIQPKLTEHGNNIRLNDRLFRRIKAVYEQKEKLNLTTEQLQLLEKTYDRFVDNGANLNTQDKEIYRQLSMQLSSYTLNFGQNVLKATNAYTLLLTDAADLAGLPQDVIDAAALKAKTQSKEGWIIDLSAPSYTAFMKYSENRNLRQQLYMAYNTKCVGGEFDNLENIRGIINTRLAIANLMGYKSYADYVLRRRMAANPQNVYDLLNELLSGFGGAAKAEYREVQGYVTGKEGRYVPVQAYDWAYYANQLKNSKFSINDEAVRPYFELSRVKECVFGLATRLYGISFKKNAQIPVYQKDVDAYEVYDKDGKYLAVLYTDFFPRTGKRPGAWMTEYQEQGIIAGKDRRPHISIVMNFTPPTATKPSLLTYEEVKTFLHEFGHSLHGMLSRVTYPSLSGTNVYRDFVELPSQLMENFMMEREYLEQIAVHYETGKKMPAEMIDNILAASNFNTGYYCLRQLSFAFSDMAYHTITEPFMGDLYAFEEQSVKSTEVLPPVKGAIHSPAFSHIFSGGYAAGYYSYKWAEVLDADAFSMFKEKGIFNTEVSQSFYQNILSKGGSDDPMKLYLRFRGKKPTTEALKRRSGIIE